MPGHLDLLFHGNLLRGVRRFGDRRGAQSPVPGTGLSTGRVAGGAVQRADDPGQRAALAGQAQRRVAAGVPGGPVGGGGAVDQPLWLPAAMAGFRPGHPQRIWLV
ncbi:hypothetical protein D3C81_1948330 [compost metagenome]